MPEMMRCSVASAWATCPVTRPSYKMTMRSQRRMVSCISLDTITTLTPLLASVSMMS